jgi:hypothetical protein
MLQSSLMMRRHHFTQCGILMILLGFALSTQAQDQSYSADSLMATFKKGSSVSVKGSEITFSGVVVEVKKSSVVFRSSDNNKVICESVSSIDGASVGQPLTVTGKVRGRGLLGNVTLDGCGPVSKTLVAEKAPAPVIHNEIALPTAPVVAPVQLPTIAPTASVAPPVATKQTTRTTPRKVAAHAVEDSIRIDDTMPQRPEMPELTIPDLPGLDTDTSTPEVPQEKPAPVRHQPRVPDQTQFPVTPIIVGVGILIATVKVAPALASALTSSFRKPAPKVESVVDQVRRKALEDLLAADRQKK